jgi:hypothetical protein
MISLHVSRQVSSDTNAQQRQIVPFPLVVLVQSSFVVSRYILRVSLSIYDDENLVTALVPSLTACLASSPGKIRRTAVWISRLLNVAFLL